MQVEVFLAKVFSSFSSTDEEDDAMFVAFPVSEPSTHTHHRAFEGTVPPHFYGEMSKTELGCHILQEKGHFTEFADFIRQHGSESSDTELIMKLKSILWAVGNVGATERGLPFLEEEELIPAVLRIADESPIPSVRGQVDHVHVVAASLIHILQNLFLCSGADFFHLPWSRNTGGLSLGSDFDTTGNANWPLHSEGFPKIYLCEPVEFPPFHDHRDKLCFQMPPWPQRRLEKCDARLVPPTAESEMEAVTAIDNLANTVIANAASRSLAKYKLPLTFFVYSQFTRLKSRPEHRGIFSSPTMLYRALHTISTNRYRLPVRRYIMEMFNLDLNVNLVDALLQCAKDLTPPPSYKPSKTEANRMSMFGPLGRSRRGGSESDDSDEGEYVPPLPQPGRTEKPALALRPVNRVVGFVVG